MNKSRGIPIEDAMQDLFQDPEFVYEYLDESLKDEDSGAFLIALHHVTKANKTNMSKLARQLGLNRGNLYTALSENGNPRWETLHAVLKALGFEMSIRKPEAS